MVRHFSLDEIVKVAVDELGDVPKALGPGDLSSLKLTRLWIAIERYTGVEVHLSDIVSCRDFDDLLALVNSFTSKEIATSKSEPNRNTSAKVSSIPLLPLQQSYLVGSDPQFTSDPVGCRHYIEIKFSNVDIEKMKKCWADLLARHPILMSRIASDGTWLQDQDAPELLVSEIASKDWIGVCDATRNSMTGRFASNDHVALVGVLSSNLDTGVALLHLSFDMLLVDGFSVEILIGELYDLLFNVESLPSANADFVTPLCSLNDVMSGALSTPSDGPFAATDTLPNLALLPSPGGKRRSIFKATISPDSWSSLIDWASRNKLSKSDIILGAFCRSMALVLSDCFLVAVTIDRRPWLERRFQTTPGPFASSSFVFIDSNLEFDQLCASIQDQIRQALARPQDCATAFLRRMRRSSDLNSYPGNSLVAFTSMLDSPASRAGNKSCFERSYEVVEASGAAIDCQVWEDDDGLSIQWNVADPETWPISLDMCIADFENFLRIIPIQVEKTEIAITNLQESYLVSRAQSSPPCGNQIAFSFKVPNLITAQELEKKVVDWLARHKLLRLFLNFNGSVESISSAPGYWRLPVVRSIEDEHSISEISLHDSIHCYQINRSFQLGAWPMFGLALSERSNGSRRLHLAFDIAIYDAPWAHYLSHELAQAIKGEQPSFDSPAVSILDQRSISAEERSLKHWKRRYRCWEEAVQSAEAPKVKLGSNHRHRMEGRSFDRESLEKAARNLGCTMDALLLSAFAKACSEECGAAIAITVVRWSDKYPHSGLTSLSWVVSTDRDVLEQAAEFDKILKSDANFDDTCGLEIFRKNMLRNPGPIVPKCNFVYTFSTPSSDSDKTSEMRLEKWGSSTPSVHIDSVSIVDSRSVKVGWDVDFQAFEEGWLESSFARYNEILESLAAGREVSAHARGALASKEYREIIQAFNRTRAFYDRTLLIHDAFEKMAARYPDKTAIETHEASITYCELNAYASAIASELLNSGLELGDRVLVSCSRGIDMVAAVLAVAKSGAVYVPTEPEWPSERFSSIVRQTDAGFLLYNSGENHRELPPGIISFNISSYRSGTELKTMLEGRRVESDALAYIIFTSGSTGEPKGVGVSHRSVANLLSWCWRKYEFSKVDKGLAVASLSFDLSVFDIFGLLGVGATIYIADNEEKKDPSTLISLVTEKGITFWNSAPVVMQQIAGELDETNEVVASTLRLMFLSGDYIPSTLPQRISSPFPNARVICLGGATEATVWSNYFEPSPNTSHLHNVPYGKPIANARYYVLDDSLRPVAKGIEGDLYIGGECLADGYYGNPELTLQHFLHDPHNYSDIGKMYKTGDRVLMGDDYNLIFVGRRDSQVKIRGYRIELQEIEHHIRKLSGVRDVTVQIRDSETSDPKIVAYVVGNDADFHPLSVKDVCRQTLPDYMVPNYVINLEALPLTPNGKLDRVSLPWPPEADDLQCCSIQSSDKVRMLVYESFADVIGYSLDPSLDIWDQGVTSFTLVQVSQHLARKLGLRIELSDVLSSPTLQGIADSIKRRRLSDQNKYHSSLQAFPQGDYQDDSAASTNPTDRQVDFFSAEDQARFKSAGLNRRKSGGGDLVYLASEAIQGHNPNIRRRSCREFEARLVPFNVVSQLLGLLAPTSANEDSFGYPSAGGIYGVETYICAKNGRVSGVADGSYYYRPESHCLELVGPIIDREAHFVYNRSIFDDAAFELYFVGSLESIAPVYGSNSERYLAVETGAMIQLLQEQASSLGIGLCPIGEISRSSVFAALDLDPNKVFMASLIGGIAVDDGLPSVQVAEIQAVPVVLIGSKTLISNGPISLSGVELCCLDGGVNGEIKFIPFEEFSSEIPTQSFFQIDSSAPVLRFFIIAVTLALRNAGYTADQFSRSSSAIGLFVSDISRTPQGSLNEISTKLATHFGFAGVGGSDSRSILEAIHLARLAIVNGQYDTVVVIGISSINSALCCSSVPLLESDSPQGIFADNEHSLAQSDGVNLFGLKIECYIIRTSTLAESLRDRSLADIVSSTRGNISSSVNRFSSQLVSDVVESVVQLIDESGYGRRQVGYIERSEFGTSAFISAEIAAFSQIFSGGDSPVPIGSVKLLPSGAALERGATSLSNIVYQFERRRIFPVSSPLGLNENDTEHLSVYFPEQEESLSADRPLSILSYFSDNGSFAHLALLPPGTR